MHLHGKNLSAESTIDLIKYLWRDFVAAVPFDGDHQARFLLAIEVQKVAARLLELGQSLAPGRLTVVFSLYQWLSGHVVLSGHLRVVESHIIDSS